MRIEFPPLQPNPWRRDWQNRLPLLCTGSSIRMETARRVGIPLVPSELLPAINHDAAELRTKKQIGDNSVVTPGKRESGSPLLPIELATDKARAAADYFLRRARQDPEAEIPSSVAATDSAWGIVFPFDGLNEGTMLIHKPNGNNSVGLIVEQFLQGALLGAHLQSVSGICVVEIYPDGRLIYRQSLMTVDYGPFNRKTDWLQRLANSIESNKNNAAGFSTPNLFNNLSDLVIMPTFIRVNIKSFGERDSKYIPPRGSFMNSETVLELSASGENLPSLIAMSLGLIPQR